MGRRLNGDMGKISTGSCLIGERDVKDIVWIFDICMACHRWAFGAQDLING